MKKWKVKSGTVSLLLLFLISSVSFAQNEITKEYHEEFTVSDATTMILENKYGDINIRNHKGNKAIVDVVVSVRARNKERAQRALEMINIIFDEPGNEISARTEIDNRLSKSGWGNDLDFSIDYSVQVPRNLNMNIANKYGDIFFDELAGFVQIDLKYGNMKGNQLTRGKEKPYSTMNLKYSKAMVEKAGWLNLNMKYSKLQLDRSRAMVVVSKYSKLYIDRISSIVAESKYDTYEIDRIENFVAEAGYCDFEFGSLSGKLKLDTKYTDVDIDRVTKGFSSITISNSYGRYKLGIDKDASYDLNGKAAYAKIHYPDNSKVSRITESNSMEVSGRVGKGDDGSVVKIITQYGSVHLED